jgi:hypothetical protein
LRLFGELIAAQLEPFTLGTRPAASSYPNRIIWLTDLKEVQVSDGTAWVGSGGSAGSLKWVEGINSPVFALADNGFDIFQFQNGNILRTMVKAPRETTPELTAFFYAADAATYDFEARAYIIRPGVTDVTSALVGNIDAKSIVIGAPDLNEAQKVVFELATANQINGVTIQQDDLILVEIVRVDTNVGDCNIIAYGTEISFV